MLKELNQTFAALCSVTSTTASALEDGAKVLKIKGASAKQVAALEAVKAISEAKENCTEAELKAACELLDMVD